MKAHIQLPSKARREIREAGKQVAQDHVKGYFNSIVHLYNLCWLIALNESKKMGNKQLTDVFNAVGDIYGGFDVDFEKCDIDTALIRLTKAAESRNIDWKRILGIEKLIDEEGVTVK